MNGSRLEKKTTGAVGIIVEEINQKQKQFKV